MPILPKDSPTQHELMLAKAKRESDAADLQIALHQADMKRKIAKKELEVFAANEQESAKQAALASGPPPDRYTEQLSMLSPLSDNGSANAILGQARQVAAARSFQSDPIAQLDLLTKGRANVATADSYGRDFENSKGTHTMTPEEYAKLEENDATRTGQLAAVREMANRRKLQKLLEKEEI